jgi:3-deoxy-D-manno-octulosonate cytidylyltransferase
MSVAIVIPARMASTRFPGKPLADLLGKPMIQWVVEAARRSEVTPDIVVATPDQEILDACRGFGADAILTRGDHPSGTDRLAEAAQTLVRDCYINLQGDEPLIAPASIRACVAPLLADPSVAMGSLCTPCAPQEEDNPAVVKVVVDQAMNALYFSRFPIPYPRNERKGPLLKHVGIYAFRRDVLTKFSTWPQTPLESTESLEQLRFLENGVRIRMSLGKASPVAVDTPEQAEEARTELARLLQGS